LAFFFAVFLAAFLAGFFSRLSWRLFSLPVLEVLFSWLALFSLALFSPALSSSQPASSATARQEQQAWAPVVAEQERPARSFRVRARPLLLPPPLLLQNPLRAIRYRPRCRRILLRHHVRRVWDRRTSLLLLTLFVASWRKNHRKAAGTGN